MTDVIGPFEQAVLLALIVSAKRPARPRDSERDSSASQTRCFSWRGVRDARAAGEQRVGDVEARAGDSDSRGASAALLRSDWSGRSCAERRQVSKRQPLSRSRVAAEGTRMTSDAMNPPRWAEAMLRSLVRPSDGESISGDLLEEYRAARRPPLGALGANVWYIKHVLSVLWQLIRPSALALAGLSILLALTVFRPGHHAPHQSPATQPMLWSLMVKGDLVRQRCALPGTSLRRGHLFRYGLPCVSANSSD